MAGRMDRWMMEECKELRKQGWEKKRKERQAGRKEVGRMAGRKEERKENEGRKRMRCQHG